jgi:hypothetical protein
VNPLFPLRSLATNVEQFEVEVFECEVDLDNARGLHPGPEDVLLRGLIIWLAQTVQIIEETAIIDGIGYLEGNG